MAKKNKGKFHPNLTLDKSMMPSRYTTVGPERAPHRSYLYAMGLTEKQINQPIVGVATCWNEAAPCNISLNRQAQSVKTGVDRAGGTPREFTTITVTDGIAMGHQGMKSSLASRDLIADYAKVRQIGPQEGNVIGIAKPVTKLAATVLDPKMILSNRFTDVLAC